MHVKKTNMCVFALLITFIYQHAILSFKGIIRPKLTYNLFIKGNHY